MNGSAGADAHAREDHRRLLVYTHLSSSVGTDVLGFSSRNEQLTPLCCSFDATTGETNPERNRYQLVLQLLEKKNGDQESDLLMTAELYAVLISRAGLASPPRPQSRLLPDDLAAQDLLAVAVQRASIIQVQL